MRPIPGGTPGRLWPGWHDPRDAMPVPATATPCRTTNASRAERARHKSQDNGQVGPGVGERHGAPTSMLTVEPALTEVPPAGTSLITSPSPPDSQSGIIVTATPRPSFCKSASAWLSASPTTSGTTTGAGWLALHTVMTTVAPGWTDVPSGGL